MNKDDIKFYVRTTGDRKFNYNIPYEIILDTERNPVKKYVEALELISDESAVLLEDDLALCKNFVEEITKVIDEYPDTIINFFTRPDSYFTTNYNCIFSFNQCTYFPKGITKKVAPVMRELLSSCHHKMYGIVLNRALNELGIKHLDYRPCLVQHIDGLSLLTGISYNRQTIYFKDYLDELNINYNDAFIVENRQKLKSLLEQDKVKWLEAKKNGIAPQGE